MRILHKIRLKISDQHTLNISDQGFLSILAKDVYADPGTATVFQTINELLYIDKIYLGYIQADTFKLRIRRDWGVFLSAGAKINGHIDNRVGMPVLHLSFSILNQFLFAWLITTVCIALFFALTFVTTSNNVDDDLLFIRLLLLGIWCGFSLLWYFMIRVSVSSARKHFTNRYQEYWS